MRAPNGDGSACRARRPSTTNRVKVVRDPRDGPADEEDPWRSEGCGGEAKPRTDCTDLTRLVAVRIVRAIVRRFRRLLGISPSGVSAEIAELRVVVEQMRGQIETIDRILQGLNHDIRSGADRSLPLFLGYAERLRLDADTAAGVAQVIERRLTEFEDRLDDLAKG